MQDLQIQSPSFSVSLTGNGAICICGDQGKHLQCYSTAGLPSQLPEGTYNTSNNNSSYQLFQFCTDPCCKEKKI